MKKKLTQVKSFITFDFPLDNRYISTLFTSLHQQYQASFPHWSLSATRKKVIARYWFWYVLIHFSTLYGLAVAITLPFNNNFNQIYFAAVLTTAIISFIILCVTQYGPQFFSIFLPKLETITSKFENQLKAELQDKFEERIQEQFATEYERLAQQREELTKQSERLNILQKELLKCRKEQLHTLSLALIFYVFDKTSGINFLQCNDKSAALLTNLYGKDQRGLKENLQLILGKKQDLTPRHRTEILNRFNEAYDFFEELQFPQGIQLLQNLELKFRE